MDQHTNGNNGPLNLNDLLDREKIEGGVWVRWETTPFEVKVAHYNKPQMMKMYELCKETKFDSGTLQTKDDMNAEKFREVFAEKVIRDWRGLTLGILSKIVVVKVPEGQEDTEVPCTQMNKTFLLKQSVQFDRWLQSACSSVDTFNAQKETVELENF